jgi:hypothetical protein
MFPTAMSLGGERAGLGPVDGDRTDPAGPVAGQLGRQHAGDAQGGDLRGPPGPTPVGCQIAVHQGLTPPGAVLARTLVQLGLQDIHPRHQAVCGRDRLQFAAADQGDAGMVGVQLLAHIAHYLFGRAGRCRRRPHCLREPGKRHRIKIGDHDPETSRTKTKRLHCNQGSPRDVSRLLVGVRIARTKRTRSRHGRSARRNRRAHPRPS